MTTIPRALVAAALGAPEASLPAGDLPVERFAARLLTFLRLPHEDDDFLAQPDGWTVALGTQLAEEAPELFLDTLLVALEQSKTPEDIETIAVGPLSELMSINGPALLPRLEGLVGKAPHLGRALGAVNSAAGGNALFWARLKSLAPPEPPQ